MAAAADRSPLLVLGILPSDSSRGGRGVPQARAAATALANLRGAQRTWLSPAMAAHGDIVCRFVRAAAVEEEEGGKAVQRRRRRRLALPTTVDPAAPHVALQLPSRASSCGCASLTHAWFAHALTAWPGARFVGKTEDDIMISLPALNFELSRLLGSDRPLWYGLMAWTGNGDIGQPRVGCWGGGFEDDPVLSAKGVRVTLGKERACPDGARPIAPAPMHEIDVRSASLAKSLAGCEYPRRWLEAMGSGRRCPNDCAAVQGLWLTHCLSRNVTLAHATWSKVHSNSFDAGWRLFAPPSNLTVVLDMNLGDKKLRQLTAEGGANAPWERAAAAIASTTSTAFPPLLYEYDPTRRAGSPQLLTSLNPDVAAHHYSTCRWGGCHPSRGEAAVSWPAWHASAPWPETSAAALGLSESTRWVGHW